VVFGSGSHLTEGGEVWPGAIRRPSDKNHSLKYKKIGALQSLISLRRAPFESRGRNRGQHRNGKRRPPIVLHSPSAEPRGLRSLVTRYANGSDQALTTRSYHCACAENEVTVWVGTGKLSVVMGIERPSLFRCAVTGVRWVRHIDKSAL
jgi:hypothetical protein